MQEIIIHSFEELSAAVFQDTWDKQVGRYRDNKVYRGVQDKLWSLVPSLNRSCPQDLGLERHILRNFKKYGYAELQAINSFWQTVATGQQFGLPTRLLDWTYSPLVAAHFASEDTTAYHLDGAIICCDMQKMNALLPAPMLHVLQSEACNVFSIDMLDHIAPDFERLAAISDEPFALFFEPASTVNRIANQYALFSLTSRPDVLVDQVAHSDDCFRRIIIPAQTKLEIRDKLDYINISERMIYPGLDGICKWIARRYAPLGKGACHADSD